MHTFTSDDQVGTIAARQPSSYRVFMKHDIDFCCGGNRALGDVCRERDLEPEALLSEIEQDAAENSASAADVNWEERSLIELIGHIIDAYHRPLRDEMPRLEFFADKVLNAHGERHADTLAPLADVVHTLMKDLEAHMAKEETVLFPWIIGGNGKSAGSPIHAMEVEHREAAEGLEAIRHYTNQFTLPEDACNTWRAYWESLQWLDRELRRHIHLENSVLFPRALAS